MYNIFYAHIFGFGRPATSVYTIDMSTLLCGFMDLTAEREQHGTLVSSVGCMVWRHGGKRKTRKCHVHILNYITL